MPNPTIKLNGTDYVIVERAEYARLTTLAKAADLPALPEPDGEGNYPALEYCRASMARDIIRERVVATWGFGLGWARGQPRASPAYSISTENTSSIRVFR